MLLQSALPTLPVAVGYNKRMFGLRNEVDVSQVVGYDMDGSFDVLQSAGLGYQPVAQYSTGADVVVVLQFCCKI